MPSTRLEVAGHKKRYDFVLGVGARDATSSLATSQLVQSLGKPLGGAILMSLVQESGTITLTIPREHGERSVTLPLAPEG